MTNSINRLAIALIATAGLALPAASAMAADAPTAAPVSFSVKTTTDYNVRAGVDAFRKGNFERSVAYNEAAIKSRMSAKRKAVAQSNLCAALANLGELEKAEAACDAALELRPDLKEAAQNKSALNFKLVQK